MKDCLREYNLADVKLFIEALDKTRHQYYQERIDISKDIVNIPGISICLQQGTVNEKEEVSRPMCSWTTMHT